MEGDDEVQKVHNPSSMDYGIGLYLIDDQMVEIPIPTKLVDRNRMHEGEHEENYFHALAGKPVVASAAICDNIVLPLLLNVQEVDSNQAYEPMDQTLLSPVPIHYGPRVLIIEDSIGYVLEGKKAKPKIVKITIID